MERFSTAAVGAAADLEVAWGRRTPRGAMLARTGSGEPAAQGGSEDEFDFGARAVKCHSSRGT